MSDLVDHVRNRCNTIGNQLSCDTARYHPIHHQPMPEGDSTRAQHAFAQHTAMRMHQAEGGVVAHCADVAEMIGDALEFGHQGTLPLRVCRRHHAERGLDRSRECDRRGDRAVAGYTRR